MREIKQQNRGVDKWSIESGTVVRVKPPGSDLFSTRGNPSVSSALGRFTSVFGMGTGGTTPLKPPGDYYQFTLEYEEEPLERESRLLNIFSVSSCANRSQDPEVSFSGTRMKMVDLGKNPYLL